MANHRFIYIINMY